jgi:stage II sporulation protein P
MKSFKAFIITKRKLQLAGSIAIITALFAAGTAAIIKSTADTVAVFSPMDEAISDAVLKEGLPKENKKSDIKSVISKLIGFDKDKPETIIKNSSSLFKEQEKDVPTPQPTETATKIPHSSPLLSREEITTASGLKMNNATNYNVDPDKLCTAELNINITGENPEVLIMHTHTTECFNGDEMSGESERTTNENYNMCQIGKIVKDTLEEYGIKTIHDKTIHDYPTYQGAYTRAFETIRKNIEKNPTIKVVLDLHRDAYIYSDGSKLRVATKINGENAAQVMLVIGTDSMGLSHQHWKENLTLASKLQNAAEKLYPGLMRPLNLRRERFNMHATTGSLLIEIGSNGNTLSEAEISARYIANALAAVLLNK